MKISLCCRTASLTALIFLNVQDEQMHEFSGRLCVYSVPTKLGHLSNLNTQRSIWTHPYRAVRQLPFERTRLLGLLPLFFDEFFQLALIVAKRLGRWGRTVLRILDRWRGSSRQVFVFGNDAERQSSGGGQDKIKRNIYVGNISRPAAAIVPAVYVYDETRSPL